MESFRQTIMGDLEKLLAKSGFGGGNAAGAGEQLFPPPAEAASARPRLSERWANRKHAAQDGGAGAPAKAGAAGNNSSQVGKNLQKAPPVPPGACEGGAPRASWEPSRKSSSSSGESRECRATALAATLGLKYLGNEEYLGQLLDKREADVLSGAVQPLNAAESAGDYSPPPARP